MWLSSISFYRQKKLISFNCVYACTCAKMDRQRDWFYDTPYECEKALREQRLKDYTLLYLLRTGLFKQIQQDIHCVQSVSLIHKLEQRIISGKLNANELDVIIQMYRHEFHTFARVPMYLCENYTQEVVQSIHKYMSKTNTMWHMPCIYEIRDFQCH